MMDKSILLTLCVCLASQVYAVMIRIDANSICQPDLGCTSNDPPFNNTNDLPEPPSVIRTKFLLYTRSNQIEAQILMADNTERLHSSNFIAARPTRFIIHGFLQHGQVKWIKDMTDEFLKKEDCNVIAVDWGDGAWLPYTRAVANTRIVGAEIALLINFLVQGEETLFQRIHLIGHSLGAHVAGYVGERIHGLGRITGLDPAAPNFIDTDPLVRLDRTDAGFVDVIHTDDSEFDYISGYGMFDPVGHVDFYPNGGKYQPGCSEETVTNLMSTAYYKGLENAEDILSCSHSRAITLFTESINSECHFTAFPCPDLDALDRNAGNCMKCEPNGCPKLGFSADQSLARGSFYLRTRPEDPYCGYYQHVTLQFGDRMSPASGRVRVQLVAPGRPSDFFEIKSDNMQFEAGQERHFLYDDLYPLTDIREVRVTFTRTWGVFWWLGYSYRPASVSIHHVTVTSIQTGQTANFCGDDRLITNGNTVYLRKRDSLEKCVPGRRGSF
ncbi:hypothetical protein CHS0354_030440 [Potamilus streckersoni]|uniref:Lipase domain-containing protein n=1 Tax=Potamilus streckersoni TaxID=2493646 RepID=A0AAE0SIX4_9BIVA|nr:hypothetical protein CHS0354_030440 [Potamilus streckersoni]